MVVRSVHGSRHGPSVSGQIRSSLSTVDSRRTLQLTPIQVQKQIGGVATIFRTFAIVSCGANYQSGARTLDAVVLWLEGGYVEGGLSGMGMEASARTGSQMGEGDVMAR